MYQEETSPLMSYGDDGNRMCSSGYEFSVVKTIIVIIIILWLLGVFKTKESFYIDYQNGINKIDGYRNSAGVYDEEYLSYPTQKSVYAGKSG